MNLEKKNNLVSKMLENQIFVRGDEEELVILVLLHSSAAETRSHFPISHTHMEKEMGLDVRPHTVACPNSFVFYLTE